ncbi:MAG: glycosyltransferase family 39 protein [Chlamydiota bacterium]|nr:glycosyltransferase family 39 protein [Chlamydiota bacterium]
MTRISTKPYFGTLLFILIIKALFVTWMIVNSQIGLSPDEAQYWTWSQNIDWGYYSKPPGIAWQIWLGTSIFNNSVLGVRVLSVVIGFFTPLLLYILARKCKLSPQASFWAATIFAFSPLGFMASILAITDVGMVFFWICALIVIAESLEIKMPPHYPLLGLFIACGALFKWPIYLLWIVLIASMPLFPVLKNKNFITGFFISLLGLVPSFTWNIKNDWATFRHVSASVAGSPLQTENHSLVGNPLEFIGAQFALVSPILFILLLMALYSIYKHKNQTQRSLLFCAFTTATLLTFVTALSLFKKVQGNWVDYAYPTAFVVIAWFACDEIKWKQRLMEIGVALSILLCLFAVTIPHAQALNLYPTLKIPYKLNPFRHNVGWKNLRKALKIVGYNPNEEFLFSSKYQMSSILNFYGPEQNRTYFLNIHGVRKNQFSFWPPMAEEQIGKTGIYVVTDNAPHLQKLRLQVPNLIVKLSPYFERIDYLGYYPIFDCYGEPCKAALLFKCKNYNGKEPKNFVLY